MGELAKDVIRKGSASWTRHMHPIMTSLSTSGLSFLTSNPVLETRNWRDSKSRNWWDPETGAIPKPETGTIPKLE